MSLPKSSAVEGQPHLTREECACIFEWEFQSVAEDIQEHQDGPKFIKRLLPDSPLSASPCSLKAVS